MLPQHLKQIRVLMLNDKENLERTLFRLEQGNASFKQVYSKCSTLIKARGCSDKVLKLLI